VRSDISCSTRDKNICHLAEFPGSRRNIAGLVAINSFTLHECKPWATPDRVRTIHATKRWPMDQRQKCVQEFLTIPNSVCDIAINPQPRKPNHTIIVDTIIAARK
jgi:hypothetical protein